MVGDKRTRFSYAEKMRNYLTKSKNVHMETEEKNVEETRECESINAKLIEWPDLPQTVITKDTQPEIMATARGFIWAWSCGFCASRALGNPVPPTCTCGRKMFKVWKI